MTAQYRCRNERRRRAVRDALPPTLNGIDFLEVGPSQTTLDVHFVHPLPLGPAEIEAENVQIEGGVRITGIRVESVSTVGSVLTVTVDASGDFSRYTLILVDLDPKAFDRELSEVEFSFKAGCESEFDCKTDARCPPEVLTEPEIDYLAKDYESFRGLMLDRIAALAPDWSERSPADAHVALVELLAYVADHLSYQQDVVATEAYLGTAHRRVSMRRHARLLDYAVHSGCNARAWIAFEVTKGSAAEGPLDAHTVLLTRGEDDTTTLAPDGLSAAITAGAVAFETLEVVTLRASHNRIGFHTWSDSECCLPRGATRATLLNDPKLFLAPGDLLALEEMRDPETGAEKTEPDPTRTHVVRLTAAVPGVDELDGTPVVDVEWDAADALPFPLCLTALVPSGGTEVVAEIGAARANVVLADHGLSVPSEPLVPDIVPEGHVYRPRLASGPLTFAFPPVSSTPASAVFKADPRDATAVLELSGEGETWAPVPDLLGSERFAPDVVVEVESDGVANLRFGDDERGRQPLSGSTFSATYRVGNGRVGNVGAGAIARVVTASGGFVRVWNPLPASGGTDPENLERVRLDAPEAFRTQERAVTENDYAAITERHVGVQRAAATFRWTGSWYSAFVTADRIGGRPVDEPFERDVRRFLDRYRMAGQDVELDGPRPVPLDLELEVCVKPGYFRSDVKHGLLEKLGSVDLRDGRRGFFHPDSFTFGQRVYLSQIYAAAMDVAGVNWVRATRFQRFGRAPNQELENEALDTARTEIARLDNDPSFPENGKLELVMRGGM